MHIKSRGVQARTCVFVYICGCMCNIYISLAYQIKKVRLRRCVVLASGGRLVVSNPKTCGTNLDLQEDIKVSSLEIENQKGGMMKTENRFFRKYHGRGHHMPQHALEMG